MIFLSVGTQLPFDRLVETVDKWADREGIHDIVAQIGPTDYRPVAMKSFAQIPPDRFSYYQQQADILISHAGMGAILGALQLGKTLIIMPRRAALGEHRNEHQLATAEQFRGKPGIHVAMDEEDLVALLSRRDTLSASQASISSFASPQLVGALRTFIADGTKGAKGR